MKVEKKIISNLTKCYSIAPLKYKGKEHFLVAAEKVDRCILFDLDGNEVETIWEEPGGVMTMQQVPGTDGQFLATHKFYSPNDSKEAKIVIVTPTKEGEWSVRTLCDLPFVHRFDVVTRNGINYLIACTLKSGHEYKDDWSMPGKVFAAVLPEDLSGYDSENQLQLTCIKDNMLKNHGYVRTEDNGVMTSLVCAESGVYQFVPPTEKEGTWEIKHLLEVPASDAVLVDFDEDGEKELGVLSPFHGDEIMIYKKKNDTFEKVYQYENKTEFTHAIFGGKICGKNRLIVGHRKAERNLLSFTYDSEKETYVVDKLDENCGPANVYHFVKDGKDKLVSTNREIDEVALYTIES